MKFWIIAILAGVACIAGALWFTRNTPAAAPGGHAVAARDLTAREFRIGMVDVGRVFAAYHKTREAERRLNEDKSRMKKEMDERAARSRDLQLRWREKQAIITNGQANEELRRQAQAESASLATEVESLEKQSREAGAARNQQLESQSNSLRAALLMDIRQRVEDLARRENFDLVFDKSATGAASGNFIPVSAEKIDVTDEVLRLLNAGVELP